jgi:hypothetical protein
MPDDDATVGIIHFTRGKKGEPLGSAPTHSESIIAQRRHALSLALTAQDQELIAILYGDGTDCRGMRLPQARIDNARTAAQALSQMRHIYLASLRTPDVPALEQAWQKYEPIFTRSENRVSAQRLLELFHDDNLLHNIVLPPGETHCDETPKGFWHRLRRFFGLEEEYQSR